MSDSPTSAIAAGKLCPTCGRPLARIVYGNPSPDMWEAEERGEMVIGGCVVMPENPTHACPAGHRWRARA